MEDYIVRATAAGGQMRAFAATTKNLVESARVHHNTSPVATAALGRTLTAGAIMGSMMKNDTDMLTLLIGGSITSGFPTYPFTSAWLSAVTVMPSIGPSPRI